MNYLIEEYKIISGENDVEIQTRVNEIMHQKNLNTYRWIPYGSLVVEKDGFMYQPMIKIFLLH